MSLQGWQRAVRNASLKSFRGSRDQEEEVNWQSGFLSPLGRKRRNVELKDPAILLSWPSRLDTPTGQMGKTRGSHPLRVTRQLSLNSKAGLSDPKTRKILIHSVTQWDRWGKLRAKKGKQHAWGHEGSQQAAGRCFASPPPTTRIIVRFTPNIKVIITH